MAHKHLREKSGRKPLSVAVLLALSSPQFSMAQSKPAPSQSETTLPEVRVQSAPESGFRTDSTSVGTRTETPLRDIPQFINSVPQAVIRTQGATTLPDALQNVPGISYAAAEGGTQSNQVLYLRGFPLNQDIYIDGVRDMGEYNRDLFATESVEVLKGPSALLFGRGGSGGLVNQTTKAPTLQPHKEVSVTLGSNRQKRAVGDLNLRTGDDSAVRLIALKESSGNYRYPQGVEKAGLAPSFWTRLGTATEATFSYYYLKSDDITDYGQPTLSAAATGTGQAAMPPIPADKYYGFAKHDYARHTTQIGTFKLEHEFSDALSIRNTLRFASYKRELEATIATLRATDANGAAVTTATPLSLLMVTRNHDGGRTRDNDDHALINQTDITWKLDTGSIRHTVMGGMELSKERLNRWNYTLDANPATAAVDTPTSATPLLNPDPGTSLNYRKTPNLRAVSQGNAVALYAQDQMELSPQWKALLGARYERFSAGAVTTSIGTGATSAGPFFRTDNMWSGRAGLIWQPTKTQSYYTSVANSYNPSGELGVYAGTAQTNLTATTEKLDPEQNRNYEIGSQWDLAGGIQVRTALFRTDKINQRIADSITGVTVLAGKRRVEGLELQVNGTITKDWDIYSAATFNSGKIVKATANQGRVPLGVADASGSVWSIYRLGEGWEVGGGVLASSGFWLTDANNGKVPAYAIANATAAYVQKKYELRLNLYNLADKTYYLGGYQNAANRVLPGQPRSISLTMRYNFD